ncbi:unnamed protein product [Ectocarpus sp. 4 AP-2014]
MSNLLEAISVFLYSLPHRARACLSSVVSHHSYFALVFATSALNMVVVESNRFLEFPSGFKCTWYGLPHPVQFAVLILMPALLYGVNWLFDRLEKASHAGLCPHATAACVEEKEGGRPEHVEAPVCQWKLDTCSTKGSPRAPLPLRHHRLDGKEKAGASCMCRRHMISTEAGR